MTIVLGRVRRRGCGCLLGVLTRTPEVGDVFVSQPRMTVRTQATVKTHETMDVRSTPLAEARVLHLGCKHGSVPAQDEALVEQLRAHVRAVARGDTPTGAPLLL